MIAPQMAAPRPGAALSLVSSLLLLLLLSVPANVGAARPMETGVTAADGGYPVTDPLAFERIRGAGASWTRVILYWRDIAPASLPETWDPTDPADPNYDWSRYDAAIQAASVAGVTPVVSFFSAPEWAERCQTDLSLSYEGTCDPDPAGLADFAEAAANRYGGGFGGLPRVRYWKVWNEPNLRLFFAPQVSDGKRVSPGLYKTLLNRVSERVKQVDPGNRVVTGGLAPFQKPGGLAPLDFMRRVLCLKGRGRPVRDPGCSGKARFDIWAHNPYTTGRPTTAARRPDDVSMGDLPEMKATLDAGVKAGRIVSERPNPPFWITEMSWDSKGPDPGGVPMNRLRTWVAETIYRAWRAGATKFFWLSLRDWGRPQNVTSGPLTIDSGLYFRGATLAEDRPKPILQAFRFPLVAFRAAGGIRVWGRTPDSGRGTVRLRFKKGGGWRTLGIVRAGSNGVFEKVVRTRLGRDQRGFVRGDLVSGGAVSERSAPFPLRLDRVSYQPPFGSPG